MFDSFCQGLFQRINTIIINERILQNLFSFFTDILDQGSLWQQKSVMFARPGVRSVSLNQKK